MHLLNRRDFLHDAALAAAVLSSGAAVGEEKSKEAAPAKKGDANDRLRVAVIGVHGRGMSHVGGFTNKKLNTEIAVICDCDEGVIGKAMSSVERAQGKAPTFVKDLRRVMDDKSIDVVSIATPNHWHALAAIWAIQAGKDVYVEKPVSHNVSEGRRIVEAARKYNKICQTGTQSRSNPGMREAHAYIQSGKLGAVTLSRGLCYKSRPSIGKVSGPQATPKTMDYDLWCGPARVIQPTRDTKNGTVHYDWHWIWEYGNGDLGNQGIHEMDKARWGLGKMELPKSVISVGGRFGYVDDGETANTQLCLFDYGDSQLTFEVRGLKTDPLKGAGVGNIYYGEKGILVCPNYNSGFVLDPAGKKVAEFRGGDDSYHYANFVAAVRARKADLLNADILEGHLSSALCHLGNISYRLGQPATFGAAAKALAGNKDGAEAFERMQEHLKANKVDLTSTPCGVGLQLDIDPKSETFLNNSEANKMLTREYRKGFEVPAKV